MSEKYNRSKKNKINKPEIIRDIPCFDFQEEDDDCEDEN